MSQKNGGSHFLNDKKAPQTTVLKPSIAVLPLITKLCN